MPNVWFVSEWRELREIYTFEVHQMPFWLPQNLYFPENYRLCVLLFPSVPLWILWAMILFGLIGNSPLCKGSLMYHNIVIFPSALNSILHDLPALDAWLFAADWSGCKRSDFEHLGLGLMRVISICLIFGAVLAHRLVGWGSAWLVVGWWKD